MLLFTTTPRLGTLSGAILITLALCAMPAAGEPVEAAKAPAPATVKAKSAKPSSPAAAPSADSIRARVARQDELTVERKRLSAAGAATGTDPTAMKEYTEVEGAVADERCTTTPA